MLIGKLGWQGARAEAEKIVSLGDLIDGEHGSGFVASQAAAAFENISRIAACLHEAFSGVLPSVRLDWAERLSQFDATRGSGTSPACRAGASSTTRPGASCRPMRTGCSGR